MPSSALEAFFLSGALLINARARHNQRALYVIEEREESREIERLGTREKKREKEKEGKREREKERKRERGKEEEEERETNGKRGHRVVDESGKGCF